MSLIHRGDKMADATVSVILQFAWNTVSSGFYSNNVFSCNMGREIQYLLD